MAKHASARKAARQSLKRQQANTTVRSKCRTAVKKLRTALTAKPANLEDAKKQLGGLLSETQRVLMKAASKNIIRFGTASRQISRLSAAVSKALTPR
ncbi:MAG: 30S ribosomal protein S20 [Deltaproteobacteria bacterium]|nr:30S ribosomal protein S20 [Deltaproteobacteria bacterium]